MSWDYKISKKAIRDLRKLGHDASRKIFRFLDERIANCDDPRRFGKSLKGDLGEYWRYRVEDYRVLCEVHDGELTVLVVKIGNRRDVYR